ncbi:hypothetical protein ACLBX9_27360 [Methylobacterium sp. A49B]|uniref:Uncharacterized protein n=1 Tax=Methylobacterium mesophilicum SR1.6/6 TaxID=908290 RepID=A0A6B9FKJ6_9HYPH|nr:hypothetical protein [Methylobacterium mesophilicum]QGY01438.1 hypothetical protein MMSR116_05635 [Methylobacterium mesophilicum SR1.6/6]
MKPLLLAVAKARPRNGPSDSGVAHADRREGNMLTGSLLWLIGVPIPVILLLWFFFLRGR